MGRPETRRPRTLSVEVPSIEPTKDGWVGFNTNSNQQFTDFLLLIERPDLLEEIEWAHDRDAHGAHGRVERDRARLDHGSTRRRRSSSARRCLRIPVAPVCSPVGPCWSTCT